MQTLDTPTRQFIDMDGSGRGLPHMPGLDGLRGLAVAGVVLFHSAFTFMPGGFLGVSTFFTLSGFLITSLLIAETRRTGGVDLRAFWSRRFRRLLPASSATLVLVVLFGLTVASAGQRLELRGDLLASLFQVANWRFLLGGTSYGDLFQAPSPVLHFWSLAIEEQFYWLFPPLLIGIIRLAAGKRRRMIGLLGALVVVSWALPLLFEMSTDRMYFGTDTRAAELLLGSLLAVVVSHREVRRRVALRYHWRTAVLAAGVACLAVQVWWWFTVAQSDGWLYDGGLGLYGLMTCAVIAAVALPTGPARLVMSAPVLRYLGERSYGIYLVHWPIFLALRQSDWELSAGVESLVGIAASLGLAEVSYRFLEQPIRRGTWPARGQGHRIALPSMLVVALLALVPMPVDEEEAPIDFDRAIEELGGDGQRPSGLDPSGGSGATTVPPPTTTTEPDEPDEPVRAPVPRVATFGDSTALLMGMGMELYIQETGVLSSSMGSVELGCPVSRFESLRDDQVWDVGEQCTNWPARWAMVLEQQPDVAQLITGAWEVLDARRPGAGDFAPIGTPEVDAFIESELTEAVDLLASRGALVLMVLWPPDGPAADGGASGRVATPPERMLHLHGIQRRVAESRPDTVRVVDLAGWFGERTNDPEWRPDGVHIQQERAAQVYREWMGPEIDRLWQEWWIERNGDAG